MNMTNGVVLLLLSVVIASLSQVLLKKSAMKQYPSWIREYLNIYVISGYGLMVISMLLTVLAFRTLEYKNGAVIESLGYLLVMLLSRSFFKEAITKNKVLGNGLILLGIFVFYI